MGVLNNPSALMWVLRGQSMRGTGQEPLEENPVGLRLLRGPRADFLKPGEPQLQFLPGGWAVATEDTSLIPGSRRFPGGGPGNLLQYFCYSLWGHKELDMTEEN